MKKPYDKTLVMIKQQRPNTASHEQIKRTLSIRISQSTTCHTKHKKVSISKHMYVLQFVIRLMCISLFYWCCITQVSSTMKKQFRQPSNL